MLLVRIVESFNDRGGGRDAVESSASLPCSLSCCLNQGRASVGREDGMMNDVSTITRRVFLLVHNGDW